MCALAPVVAGIVDEEDTVGTESDVALVGDEVLAVHESPYVPSAKEQMGSVRV